MEYVKTFKLPAVPHELARLIKPKKSEIKIVYLGNREHYILARLDFGSKPKVTFEPDVANVTMSLPEYESTFKSIKTFYVTVSEVSYKGNKYSLLFLPELVLLRALFKNPIQAKQYKFEDNFSCRFEDVTGNNEYSLLKLYDKFAK